MYARSTDRHHLARQDKSDDGLAVEALRAHGALCIRPVYGLNSTDVAASYCAVLIGSAG